MLGKTLHNEYHHKGITVQVNNNAGIKVCLEQGAE